MYLFFSSDIYSLYKKDILAAISLPTDYSIHFRYPKKFVPADFFALPVGIKRLKEKEGIIIYVKGNDNNQLPQNRNISFIPIRMVRVRDIYYDSTTDLVHVFLILGPFIKSDVIPTQVTGNTKMDLPPHKFIHNIDLQSSSLQNWHEKIADLVQFDPFFNDHLFFKINVSHAEESYKDQAEITFDRDEYSSKFQLKEDKDYLLDLAIYNTAIDIKKFEDYYIKLSYPTDYFFVTNPETISIGAMADNRKYQIITKDTASLSSYAYLKVQSFRKDHPNDEVIYEEIIRLHIARNKNKVWWYVGLTLTGVAGTSILAYASSLLGSDKPTPDNLPLLFVAGVGLIMLTAAAHFYYFNKRS